MQSCMHCLMRFSASLEAGHSQSVLQACCACQVQSAEGVPSFVLSDAKVILDSGLGCNNPKATLSTHDCICGAIAGFCMHSGSASHIGSDRVIVQVPRPGLPNAPSGHSQGGCIWRGCIG